MSSKALGPDASRQAPRANALAPPSDNCLNSEHIAPITSSGTERKHDAYAMEDLLKAAIVVKPYPSKLSIKPRSLQPLMLLPREFLPLSCLDLATPLGDFEYARQYESTIKILDLESRMGNRPVVLVARMESNKTAYAIERQNSGLYSLCRLGSWVDLIEISNNATVTHSKLLKARTIPVSDTQPDASTTPQLHKESKKRRLAMEAIQSLVKRPARSQSISLSSQVAGETQISEGIQDETPRNPIKPQEPVKDVCASRTENTITSSAGTPGPEQISPSLSADDIFENVRVQYFEALYHSMGSLAYFVKGPLSRARAAFHLDSNCNLDMNELIEFLKSLVLTTIQIDKKYRETVPGVIAKMKTHVANSADEEHVKPKKRKTKKIKLGKDALYPNEDEHIRKWWAIRKPQPRDDDSVAVENPQENRLQLSRLRSRETQLQMILILEILVLEPLKSAAHTEDSQLPGSSKEEPVSDTSKELSTKKRNKHNFPVLLDVHADRLSIWQSTSFDEIKIMDNSQSGVLDAVQNPNGSNSDPLKDFCVEIIVPFFLSRLPAECDSLNRKLGGPVLPSPQKSKPQKSEAMAKPKARPGTLTKRPSTTKPARTLERVLSKETERHRRSVSRGPGSMIALMRSATTPAPMLKREISDTASLSSVSTKDIKDVNGSQDGFSGVFPAPKRATQEEKARREADIQAELQEAISSLRKPNRGVVVSKAMAEADQRRATTSLSQLKKSRKPTEHPGTHSIIKATPAGPRFRNALARETHGQPTMGNFHEMIEPDIIHSSSRAVLSSTPRKRKADAAFMIAESSPALQSTYTPAQMINATPIRPVMKRDLVSASEADEGLILASSPVATRRFLAVPNSTLKHRDSGIGMPSSPAGGVAETPLKRPQLNRLGSLEGFVTVTPIKKRVQDSFVATPIQPKLGQEKKPTVRQVSIYEKLGWDDEYDDLL